MQKADFCTSMRRIEVTVIQQLDHSSTEANWRAINVIQPMAKFRLKHLWVAEYIHSPTQFLRFRPPRQGRTGAWVGGSERKFKLVALVFRHDGGPTEFRTKANGFESSPSESASEAEDDWSDKHTLLMAIKASHPEADSSLAFLSSSTTLTKAKRVSARLQNPHTDFKVRLATHQTPVDTTSSLTKLQDITSARWSRGETVRFMFMLGQIFHSPANAAYPIIQLRPK
jgi:hypothetical protein